MERQLERARETLEAVRARVAEEQDEPPSGAVEAGSFFDRSVHEVARDLIGCQLLGVGPPG